MALCANARVYLAPAPRAMLVAMRGLVVLAVLVGAGVLAVAGCTAFGACNGTPYVRTGTIDPPDGGIPDALQCTVEQCVCFNGQGPATACSASRGADGGIDIRCTCPSVCD